MGCSGFKESNPNRIKNKNKHHDSKSHHKHHHHHHHHKHKHSSHMLDDNLNNENNHNRINPHFQVEPYLESQHDPYFNFLEVNEDKYVGTGLKRMKCYISNISKNDLLKKRNEFWETRVEGNKEIWLFLRRICEEPEFEQEDVSEYLNAMDLVPYENCINITYDAFGYLYEIPNYCIHWPLRYELDDDESKKPKTNKEIEIIIRNGSDVNNFKVSLFMTGQQLKQTIAERYENILLNNIRLFYLGKEIDNNKELWIYKIENKSNILMMVNTS